jgi:GPH family glycoside/pentoside/hexuronide:cation symporter
MKTITKGKMWCFAIGQFGWSLLSALITNWLVYFYQPDADSIAAGQTLFIPQGRVIFGIATVIGGIAALGRVFDAVTDPMIANLSDRSQNPKGRRIPFMQKIAIPFALVTVLVFWAPVNEISTANCIWLLVTLLLFYLFMTTYCTPYNALISELGTTQDTRISIST